MLESRNCGSLRSLALWQFIALEREGLPQREVWDYNYPLATPPLQKDGSLEEFPDKMSITQSFETVKQFE